MKVFTAPNTNLANALFTGGHTFVETSGNRQFAGSRFEGRNLVNAGALLRPHLDARIGEATTTLWTEFTELHQLLRGQQRRYIETMPPVVERIGRNLLTVNSGEYTAAVHAAMKYVDALKEPAPRVVQPLTEPRRVTASADQIMLRSLADGLVARYENCMSDGRKIALLAVGLVKLAHDLTRTDWQSLMYCEGHGGNTCPELARYLGYTTEQMKLLSGAITVSHRDANDLFHSAEMKRIRINW